MPSNSVENRGKRSGLYASQAINKANVATTAAKNFIVLLCLLTNPPYVIEGAHYLERNPRVLYSMFLLAEMQDVVRIEPRRFAQDMGQEIADELNRKFANKVSDYEIYLLMQY